jgi:hypothetical protein
MNPCHAISGPESSRDNAEAAEPRVLRLGELSGGTDNPSIRALLERLGLSLHAVAPGRAIPGSYWGDEEAGLRGERLFVRPDTPVHSVLHEACHYACMDPARRAVLDTDAGGDHDEENAVCYLQILLADRVDGFGRDRMLADMDAWGYSFRLGSARRWFREDADDARRWLLREGLIDMAGLPTGRLRASG